MFPTLHPNVIDSYALRQEAARARAQAIGALFAWMFARRPRRRVTEALNWR